MDKKEKLSRTVEALRGIYRTKGLDLSEAEATVMANHLGKKPARAAIICGVVILALVAFLIIRFVL